MGISNVKGSYLTDLESSLSGESFSKLDGAQRENVYGSYVHGIFDCDNVAKTIVSALLKQKGYSDDNIFSFDMKAYKQRQYDILADAVRNSFNMDRIYEIIDKGV